MEREISIRVPAFDSFVTEYSANVSTTGMFIRSDKPLPPDTNLAFEFRVADDWKLIRGKATVVWSRYRDEGPERPAGMGVLFTEVDAQSRRLINWIIEKHVRDGGTPFDLGELREQFDENLAEMSEAEGDTAMPPPVTRVLKQPKFAPDQPSPKKPSVRTKTTAPLPVEPLRLRLGPLLVAGLVVAVVLGGLFWLSEQGAQSAANPDLPEGTSTSDGVSVAESDAGEVAPSPTSAEADAAAPPASDSPARVVAEPPATPTAASPAPAAAAPAATPPAVAEAVRRLVGSWSEAWQNQDVEAYVAHYSRRFAPADGQTRTAWAASRQQRLTAPEFIEITVTDLEIEWLGDTSARAAFDQRYRSNTFEDSVSKVLELVREDGRWKILEEKAAG